jgi:hypothetical protein
MEKVEKVKRGRKKKVENDARMRTTTTMMVVMRGG